MLGLVLEVNGKTCLAIDKSGVIHKVPCKKGADAGDFVQIPQRKFTTIILTVSAAVIAFSLAASFWVMDTGRLLPESLGISVAETPAPSSEMIIENGQVPAADSPPEKQANSSRAIAGALAATGGGTAFILYKRWRNSEKNKV